MEYLKIDDTQGFIRVKEIAKYLGIGVSTCWIKSKHEKEFPKPRKISSRITVWNKAEVDLWVRRNDHVAESDDVID